MFYLFYSGGDTYLAASLWSSRYIFACLQGVTELPCISHCPWSRILVSTSWTHQDMEYQCAIVADVFNCTFICDIIVQLFTERVLALLWTFHTIQGLIHSRIADTLIIILTSVNDYVIMLMIMCRIMLVYLTITIRYTDRLVCYYYNTILFVPLCIFIYVHIG